MRVSVHPTGGTYMLLSTEKDGANDAKNMIHFPGVEEVIPVTP